MTDPNAEGAQQELEAGQSPATPEPAAERNADEDENRGKLIASLQEKAAKVNDAERRAAQAEAERDRYKAQMEARAQSPAAPRDQRAERLATVQRFADGTIGDGPDPVAAEVLALREELALTTQELVNVRELDRIGDEEKRKRVAQHFNDNRHRLGDVRGARAEIEAEERAATVRSQQEEIDKLRKALEAQSKRPGSDTVQTHVQEVGAAEHKQVMTQAQWDDRQAALERAWQAGDLNASKQIRAEQLQRANGKIRVEG